ncbi:MAG: hypothetical protein EU539_02620 [Promethearchaeota archaeon]|nr:MAG: hypothetical protein EU539_02620 [Candidatus Lokiarchaeota archaeon]
MKKTQILCLISLGWILILSSISFAYAATPGYVGIENNQSFIWNTTYDDDPFKDRIEDEGEEYGDSEEEIEEDQDEIDMNEDLTQVKIVILDVDDEEKTPWGEEGVRIIYNHYMKEEGEDWELENKDETFAIWQFDNDFYYSGFFFFSWESEFDEDDLEWERYQYIRGENPWFISTKVDWREVKEQTVELYEDDLDYDEVKFKIYKDKIGFELTLDNDDDDEIEERKYISEYDDNGVLMYWEYQYDGDPAIIIEREFKFIYDNIIWIVLGIVGIIAVLVIIVIVLKKR